MEVEFRALEMLVMTIGGLCGATGGYSGEKNAL